MIIVGCPVCGDSVVAPSGSPVEAMVRCPLCMEEYRLSDAFAKLPPALILLESSLVGSLSLEPESAEDAAPAFEFEAGSAPVEPRVYVRQPARVNRQKNVIVEFTKIVLGGVLGLAIGQVLLWRMPGNWPAHQRDPFQFGQDFGNIFPISILAPPLVRNPGVISESEHDEDTDDWTIDPNIVDQPMMNEDSRTDETDIAGDNIENGGSPEPEPAVPATSPGIRFAPHVDQRMMVRAIELSRNAIEQWRTADGDRELEAANLVSSLKDLAHAVTFIYPERRVPSGVVAQLREFLPQFSRPPLKELLYDGIAEVDVDKASLTGEIVVGIVDDIRLNGYLFETVLELSPGVKVPVLSAVDPRERFTKKDRVLMLAVWVTRPRTQLSGYNEPPDGPVLYGDFPVRLVVDRSSIPDDADADVDSTDASESSTGDTESSDNPAEPDGSDNSSGP